MTSSIPSADSVYVSNNNNNKSVAVDQSSAQPSTQEKVELTPEQLKQKEEFRQTQINRAVTFVTNDIVSKSGDKIVVRAKKVLSGGKQPPMVMTNIFKLSMPSVTRGSKTKYYSYVCVNSELGKCSFEYFRPQKHSIVLWYFPLIYLMNGQNRNPERTFAKLNLVSVMDKLAPEFTPKGYTVKMRNNQFCECQTNTSTNGCIRCRVVTLFWTNPNAPTQTASAPTATPSTPQS